MIASIWLVEQAKLAEHMNEQKSAWPDIVMNSLHISTRVIHAVRLR